MKKINKIDHLTGHKALESGFMNCQVLPMVREGKNRVFIYRVNLKEGEEFLFQTITKPRVEVLAVDKNGRKRDEFSTSMVLIGETKWLARFIIG